MHRDKEWSHEIAEVVKGEITQGFVAPQHGGQTDQSFDYYCVISHKFLNFCEFQVLSFVNWE